MIFTLDKGALAQAEARETHHSCDQSRCLCQGNPGCKCASPSAWGISKNAVSLVVLHNLVIRFREALCWFVISNALQDQAMGSLLHIYVVSLSYGSDSGSH